MAYSDQDLLVASSVAYYQISEKDLRYWVSKGIKEPTLAQVASHNSGIRNILEANLREAHSKGDPQAISKAEGEIALYSEIIGGDSKYSDWKVVDVKDENKKAGFYGVTLETRDDSAIVGFRGSEAYDNQFELDWVNADFSMLNSDGMKQQELAEKYMEEIYGRFDYDKYATAGHSLGGNLSFHAAITAPPEMRAKILQALNADGPGFALEYLLNPKHIAGIRDMSGKMYHYQWSLVGALLHPVPGANYMSVKTKDSVYEKYDLGSLTIKHSPFFVEIDENGNVIKGKMDSFAESIGRLSRETDESTSTIGNALISGIKSFLALSKTEKMVLGGALIANVALFALTHPVATVAALVVVAAVAVVGWINPEFFGEVLIPFILNTASATQDLAQQFIDGIKSLVVSALEAYNVANAFVNQLMAEIENVLSDFISWVRKGLSGGYRYASNHPVIKVDTYKLRDYAQLIDSVNKRLKNLDRRMDSLYWKVGFLDLLSLVQADLMTHKSLSLTLCSSYLKETAEDFETAERNIQNKL